MATETMTLSYTDLPVKRRLPKNIKLPPENERYMRACADIASALVQDYEEGHQPEPAAGPDREEALFEDAAAADGHYRGRAGAL